MLTVDEFFAFNQEFASVESALMRIVNGLPDVKLPELPRQSGVYFVLNDKDEVVYVGKSVNLRSRWAGHQFKGEVASGEFRLRWKPKQTQFRSLEHEEMLFITALAPFYNVKVC